MARSKSARRRRSAQIPYGKMRPTSNWVVGSQALTSAGQVVGGVGSPTSIPTWNPGSQSTNYLIVGGSPVTFQACVIQPGVSGNTPTVGRVRVDEIKGKILVNPGVLAGGYITVSVGIYVSEFTINTSAWDVSDPSSPVDGSRDDWWFLEARTFGLPLGASLVGVSPMMEIDISFKGPIVLGGGQALNVTVAVTGPGSPGAQCTPAFRTRIGPVA